MNSRYIHPPPEDNAGALEKENYDNPYPLPKSGTCEYYISSTLYVTKWLLAHLFYTTYTPQLHPFRYSETPFYYMDHTPQPSIKDNEGSATCKSISIERTSRKQSTASQGRDSNGVIISRCRYHYGDVTTSNNAYALWCLMWYYCLTNGGAGTQVQCGAFPIVMLSHVFASLITMNKHWGHLRNWWRPLHPAPILFSSIPSWVSHLIHLILTNPSSFKRYHSEHTLGAPEESV